MEVKQARQIDLSVDHVSRAEIESIVGFEVKLLGLYQRALVHESINTIVNKSDPNSVKQYYKESNERLEFLGDSILGAVVAEYLFRKFPLKDEGFMTKVKTRIVNGERLAFFAEKIGINGKILMSNQAISVGGLDNYHFTEDALEATIGAIYLDYNYEKAKEFILGLFKKYLDEEEILCDTNYKDKLIRYCKEVKIPVPIFSLRSTDGPAHEKIFTLDVILFNKELYGTGVEKSKKAAEQSASKITLIKLELI